MDIDARHRHSVRSIALLDVDGTTNVRIDNKSPAAVIAFGRIGWLTQEHANDVHSDQYKKKISDRNILFAPVMEKSIERKLQAAGYRVIELKGMRPVVSQTGDTADYSGIHTDADALLYISFSDVGYYAEYSSTQYRPWGTATAQLVDAKTHETLYTKLLRCRRTLETVIRPLGGARYSFPNFDELFNARFDVGIEGINRCETDIASQITEQLSGNAVGDVENDAADRYDDEISIPISTLKQPPALTAPPPPTLSRTVAPDDLMRHLIERVTVIAASPMGSKLRLKIKANGDFSVTNLRSQRYSDGSWLADVANNQVCLVLNNPSFKAMQTCYHAQATEAVVKVQSVSGSYYFDLSAADVLAQ